jgi:hypothetical protein
MSAQNVYKLCGKYFDQVSMKSLIEFPDTDITLNNNLYLTCQKISMSNLPSDIIIKTDKLFPDADENAEIKKLLSGLWKRNLNVSPEQLARNILVLSDSDINIARSCFENDEDPRDTILYAENLPGNPGHYFIPSFPEIDSQIQ